jgi:predicted SAM-dependent methyltransferase
MYLNLGCNDKYIQGWINIDINPNCGADVVGDVSDLTKIPELISDKKTGRLYVIEKIVAYDIIEHFDLAQIPNILKSWYDHLVPNGILYIRTNDLDRMIKLYQTDPITFPANKFIWHLMSEHNKLGMGHKWCFTKQTLFDALLCAGFKKIRVTKENDVHIGNYPYSFTKYDNCNMHMIAEKT